MPIGAAVHSGIAYVSEMLAGTISWTLLHWAIR